MTKKKNSNKTNSLLRNVAIGGTLLGWGLYEAFKFMLTPLTEDNYANAATLSKRSERRNYKEARKSLMKVAKSNNMQLMEE